MNINSLTSEIAIRQNFEKITTYWNMLPDPDPILRKTAKDIAAYREIINDPHVYSTIQQRKSGTLAMNWELQRLNANEFEFELINHTLNNLPIVNIIDQALNTPFFGFTVFEIVWKKQGKFILPERIEEKPQEWFFFDLNNNLNLKKQSNSILSEGIPVDPLKFILLQHKPTYINPYGERVLSRCFWPVTFKRGGLKFWITFTEKYGQPFLIGKLPRGSSQDDINNLLISLENMIQDAVAVIPDDSSIDIKEAQKTSSSEVFQSLINFMNNEISKAILTQTLTTEIQDKGTYAATSVMAEMLNRVVNTDKRLVESLFNQLIKLIYEINFNSENMPKFILYKEEDVDKPLAERDQILVNTGIRFTKEYYIKNYNLNEEDFELINQNNSQTPFIASEINQSQTPFVASETNKSHPSLSGDFTQILNNIPDKLLQLQIEAALKPILRLVEEGNSYEVLMENLAKQYPQMNAEQLEQLLSKLIFIAEINGRFNNDNA